MSDILNETPYTVSSYALNLTVYAILKIGGNKWQEHSGFMDIPRWMSEELEEFVSRWDEEGATTEYERAILADILNDELNEGGALKDVTEEEFWDNIEQEFGWNIIGTYFGRALARAMAERKEAQDDGTGDVSGEDTATT